MSEDDKCSLCGAALKKGQSLMEPGPASRCAVCGAALAVADAELPYTIEFASDQRAESHAETKAEIGHPAPGAGRPISPAFSRTASELEGESI
jgi:hypothetical protein